MAGRSLETLRRAALFISPEQAILNIRFATLTPLHGLDFLRFDRRSGTIYYRQWPDIQKERLLQAQVVFPPRSSGADPLAPRSRYQEPKQAVVHEVKKDEGRVETGILIFQHIIDNILKKETLQAESLGESVSGLRNFWGGRSPLKIGEDEYKKVERLACESMEAVDLDPETVINKKKRDMTGWIFKGVSRRDSTGDFNPLIERLALGAAARVAVLRLHELQYPMLTKYREGLEALEFEREMSGFIFSRTVLKLETPDQVFVPHLGSMITQLGFIHLKGYKPVANATVPLLEEARRLIEAGQRAEAYRRKLFPKVKVLLVDEMEEGQRIINGKYT